MEGGSKSEGDDPNYIFHYTSNNGLVGILNSASLWLTDIEFLNDHNEYNYFLDKVKDTLLGRSNHYSNAKYEWIADRITTIDEYIGVSRIFVGSFTTERNSLSQWRGYSDGSGFNLRFSFPKLKKHVESLGCSLSQVIYSEEDANCEAVKIVDNLALAYEMEETPDLARESLEIDQVFRIREMAAIFKDEAFESENEWRIVKAGKINRPQNFEINIRSASKLLIPYTHIDLISHGEDCDSAENCKCKAVFDRIMIGPGQDQNSQTRALKVFKISNSKHFNFNTIQSNIPFRGL